MTANFSLDGNGLRGRGSTAVKGLNINQLQRQDFDGFQSGLKLGSDQALYLFRISSRKAHVLRGIENS
jgi:hypothetical protein